MPRLEINKRLTKTFRVLVHRKSPLMRKAAWHDATGWDTEERAMEFFKACMREGRTARVYNLKKIVASFDVNFTLRQFKKGWLTTNALPL